jgi:integrase
MNRDKSQATQGVQPKGSRNAHARERDSQNGPVYHPAVQDSRMTFDLYVETKFIPEHVAYKSSSGQTHYQAILKHLLTPERVNQFFNSRYVNNARLRSVPQWPYLDGVRLCDLKGDHVRRIIGASQAAGYASQTVKHIKNVFFAIISHAQKEGCFSGVNPAALVKLPRIVRTAQHSLTMQQSMAMLELLPSPEKEAALFAITTGMTLIELCQLRWEHVNLSNSDRHLEGELIPAWSIGVRATWNRAGIGDGRGGTRNRNIHVCEPLLSLLKELRARNSNADKDGFVLVSEMGSPISRASIRLTRLKQAGRELGIPWVNWQIVRRTHAGVPHYVTSALQDPATTMSVRGTANAAGGQFVSVAARDRKSTVQDEAKPCRTFCFGNRFQRV